MCNLLFVVTVYVGLEVETAVLVDPRREVHDVNGDQLEWMGQYFLTKPVRLLSTSKLPSSFAVNLIQ